MTSRTQTAFGTTKTYTYDGRGNEATESTGWDRTYDYANRLLTRELSAGNTLDYDWTSDGKMWKSQNAVATNRYDYDEQGRLVSIDSGGSARRHVIYDQQGIIGYNVPGGSTFFAYHNHRGDVLSYTNSSGTTAASYQYSPFGAVDGAASPFTWNGRDGVLHLTNHNEFWMGARSYNPELGRFRQTDPMPGQSGVTDTAYSYASNDPVNNTDPTGMSTWKNKRRVVEWSHVDPVGLKVVKSGIEIKWKSNGTQVKDGRCRFSYTLTKWDPWYYTPVSVWQNVSLPGAPNMHQCTVEHRNLSWVQGFSRHTWYNDVFHHYYNTAITDALNNISGFCANEARATWATFSVALAGYPKGSEANTLNNRVIGGCASRLHAETHGVNRLPSNGTRNADYPFSGALGIKWEHKRSVQMKAKPAFP